MELDPVQSRVLQNLIDGRTHTTGQAGARMAVLRRMEEAGLVSSDVRNMGFYGRARLNWSITHKGLQEILDAEFSGAAKTTPLSEIEQYSREHREDAKLFRGAGSERSGLTADWLVLAAAIYDEHIRRCRERLNEAVARFAAEHPELAVSDAVRDRCGEISSLFCDLLQEMGIKCWQDEIAVVDGTSHRVAWAEGHWIDWTARQFDPSAGWPLIGREDEPWPLPSDYGKPAIPG